MGNVGTNANRRIAASIFAASAACAGAAYAQPADIVRDGSLGDPNAPLEVPETAGTFEILESYGERSGANLFHSFERFNVFDGRTARFLGSGVPTDNVLVRVTGVGEQSVIQGTIAFDPSLGAADLFLLNPSGVAFGTGANLDLPGSFYVSTADVLRFPDGNDFAIDLTQAAVLSFEAPSAFGFVRADPARISLSADADLGTLPANTFSAVGDLEFLVGGSPEVIDSPGSHVQLVAISGPAEIPVDARDVVPGSYAEGALGSVSLVGTGIDTRAPLGSGEESGSIVIRGSHFVLENAALLTAHDATTPANGGIDVEASDSLRIENGVVRADNFSSGTGPGIRLASSDVTILTDDGVTNVDVRNLGTGPGGALRIEGNHVAIGGQADVTTQTVGVGAGGEVSVEASIFELAGGVDSDGVLLNARIRSVATDDGSGGGISIDADTALVDRGQILSTTSGNATATGGAIQLRVRELEVRGSGAGPLTGARIATATSGLATGGALLVEGASGAPAEIVRVSSAPGDGDNARLSTFTSGLDDGIGGLAGPGGSLQVRSRNVVLEGGGQIFAETSGDGNAGALSVADADLVDLSGGLVVGADFRPSGITTRARAGSTGDGSTLDIDARRVTLSGGAVVSATTFGQGTGGSVRIGNSERVLLDGVGTVVAASSFLAGSSSGSIFIEANRIALVDGAQVTTSTFGGQGAGNVMLVAGDLRISGEGSSVFSQANGGTGSAGRVVATAERTIVVEDGGEISAELGLDAAGAGGSVTLAAGGSISLRRGGTISAQSLGATDAGDIDLSGGRIVVSESAVTTEAANAAGGQISVSASDLVYVLDSEVTAEVQGRTGDSNAGNVTIAGDRFTVLNRSDVLARAVDGDGGNIEIGGERVFLSGDSSIDASSRFGVSGEVEITSPQTSLLAQLESLQAELAQPPPLASDECSARRSRLGSFIVEPAGSVEIPPDEAPLSDALEGAQRPSCP